jgi:hypothetical protein
MSDDSANLTGTWNGLYFYPGNGKPVPFIADLNDAGQHFTGTIEETDSVWDMGPMSAIVDGRRAGSMVFFTKTYDGRGGWFHSVAYEGVINADVTEIHGSWAVHGISGTFLMTRPGAVAKAVSREAEDRVDTPERVS